jgi:hypothetical protein
MRTKNQKAIKQIFVIEEYKAAYPNPIKVMSGDELVLGKMDLENPGWAWCTSVPDKKSGWMPVEYISILGERQYALCDYDAKELTVSKGEELAFIKSVKGWIFCEKKNGEMGWVPEDKVELIEIPPK